MGINFHGSADAGVPDGFRECCQVKIGIVLVLDIIVGHISMSVAVDGYFVGQSYLFADLSMGLICTGANTTAKGEIGGSADILMLSTDYPTCLFEMINSNLSNCSAETIPSGSGQ